MLGYLIFDSDFIKKEAAEIAISRMITFKLHKKISIGKTEIIIIVNQNSNNYLWESNNYFLCATGTIIFNGVKGNDALKQLSEALDLGKNLKNIYPLFRGPYNFICLNKKSEELRVITSKEGLQNGFFCERQENIALSSNLLLLASLVDTTLDEFGIREFVHFGACMEEKTVFKDIKKMRAGTMFSNIENKWHQKRFWQIEAKYPYKSDSASEIVKKTSSMLSNVLEVVSDTKGKKFAVDLTGGADTRTILSFLLKYRKNMEVSTGGPENHRDVIIAKRIAKKLGLTHFRYNYDISKQKMTKEQIELATEVADGNWNPFFIIKQLSQLKDKTRRYDIILGGNGGPLYKDHYWLFEFNRINRLREPKWERISKHSIINYPINDRLFVSEKEGIFSYISKMFLNYSKNIHGTNNQKLDYVYFGLKCIGFHTPVFTVTNQFLDVYHPLLDGDIVEYMINIKPDIRKRNVLLFSMIYQNSKDLAWIRTDNECPAVPSVGKFAFLRIYVLMRYFRALLRKLDTFILKRSLSRVDPYLTSLTEQLGELGYFHMLNYNGMKTAPLFSEEEFLSIMQGSDSVSNLMYILNILSVELSIKRAEELGNKTISL